MAHCAQCGAPLAEGSTCIEYLHELLALEARVGGGPGELTHFLAVAAYNLQHPSMFTPAVLAGLRTTFGDVLAGRATIADARQRARAGAEGAVRVIRRPDTPIPPDEVTVLRAWPTRWSVTVRDVCRVSPRDYAGAVRRWATAVGVELPESW